MPRPLKGISVMIIKCTELKISWFKCEFWCFAYVLFYFYIYVYFEKENYKGILQVIQSLTYESIFKIFIMYVHKNSCQIVLS